MSTTGKPICTPINKEAILKRFNTKSKANLNILQLIEALPEVFSREPLNPENFTQGYRVPPSEELFATALPNNRQQNFISKPKTVSKSPFSASGQVENLEAKVWYYIDEEGNSQGPFTTLQMDEWYDAKYFENDLQIRRAGQDNFTKLIDALTRSDNTGGRTFQKQAQFERGQYKPQYRSDRPANENTWDRGKNFTRNNQTENKASGMPITRNISDTKAASDKQNETQEHLSIARNQSENKTKTETPAAEPLNLEVQKKPAEVQKKPEAQKPVAVEKPVVAEVEQPEVKVQEPTEPAKVEEAPKEEKQEEQQAPAEEEKKEPEQKATLTQNPREFISDEWKVTIKKKKGKRGKYDEEEPEEPVRPVQVAQSKREEPEAKSPTKANKEVPSVVAEQQPKKKIIAGWGGEEPKKQKEPVKPEEEFPSLGSAPPKKTAPTSQVVEKKKQPVQEPKQTQSLPQADFPGLGAAVKNTKPEPVPKTKPVAAQTQEKPKAVIPESKPKKQTAPEIQEDFPTIPTNSDFPSLGQAQPKAKPIAKPQPKANVEAPKKSTTNKVSTSAPKENLSENPKYLNDFPTL